MHLRKTLVVLVVALLAVGALGATASAGTAKPKPAAKKVCTLGQDVTKHTCLPNPLYARNACDGLEPALSAIVGGPLHPQHPNPSAPVTAIACAFFAGSDYRATVYVYNEADAVARDRAHPPTALVGPAALPGILATERKWAAAPLSLLQSLYENPNAQPPAGYPPTGRNICFEDTGNWADTAIPFDVPRLIAGVGDLAFVWDTCADALAGVQPCPTPSSAPVLAAPCLPSNLTWSSEVYVAKGQAAYSVYVPRPSSAASDDQLVAFVKTLMAKYH